MFHCVPTDMMNTRKWELKLSEMVVGPALKEKILCLWGDGIQRRRRIFILTKILIETIMCEATDKMSKTETVPHCMEFYVFFQTQIYI